MSVLGSPVIGNSPFIFSNTTSARALVYIWRHNCADDTVYSKDVCDCISIIVITFVFTDFQFCG